MHAQCKIAKYILISLHDEKNESPRVTLNDLKSFPHSSTLRAIKGNLVIEKFVCWINMYIPTAKYNSFRVKRST
jgi:hypothetical protein